MLVDIALEADSAKNRRKNALPVFRSVAMEFCGNQTLLATFAHLFLEGFTDFTATLFVRRNKLVA